MVEGEGSALRLVLENQGTYCRTLHPSVIRVIRVLWRAEFLGATVSGGVPQHLGRSWARLGRGTAEMRWCLGSTKTCYGGAPQRVVGVRRGFGGPRGASWAALCPLSRGGGLARWSWMGAWREGVRRVPKQLSGERREHARKFSGGLSVIYGYRGT